MAVFYINFIIKKAEEKIMNNNVKTSKTSKTSKLATYRKAVITSSLVAILIASSSISALAAPPTGVDVSSMNTVVDVIFWIVRVAIGACTLVPGVLHIAQGASNQDDRLKNSGIMSCVVGVACIGALEVIKGVAF